MEDSSPQERFEYLIRTDRRYHPEAYRFIYDALDYTVRLKHGANGSTGDADEPENYHVTGMDLLEGLRLYALDEFGCLAAAVFEAWGVRRSEDFGEIVFNLVEHELMGKQESDSRQDFACGYGGRPFREVFDVRPVLEYSSERDEWKTSYVSAENVGHG